MACVRRRRVRRWPTSATRWGQALLYEAESVRRFVGLSLSEALPDETTILNFRHLLERHKLGKALFDEINAHLESQGLRLREGSIVDASIIEAPSSTKNRTRSLSEKHQAPTIIVVLALIVRYLIQILPICIHM